MNFTSKISNRFIAALLCAVLYPSLASPHFPIPPKQPSEIGRRIVKTTVPDFNLTDQNGDMFRFRRTRGKLVVVTFIFTACPDVCPLLTAKLAAIQRALEEKKFADYRLLSITTDPEADSAAKLKSYAGLFKADLSRWSFLTGAPAQLAKVWKAFGVNVTKTDAGQVFHTGLTTLIDRHGNRRVDYYGEKWLEKEVLKDLQWLGGQK